jgi:hypothetical protein
MDARWRDNVEEVAKEFNWAEDMVALAKEIVQGL